MADTVGWETSASWAELFPCLAIAAQTLWFQCQPWPQGLQHFRRRLPKSTGLFRVLCPAVRQKGFSGWSDGLAMVPAVTFRTVKPQSPALAGFHKRSQAKFMFLSFKTTGWSQMWQSRHVLCQACTSSAKLWCASILSISLMLVWETRGRHAVWPHSKTF